MFHRVLVATGGSPWSDNAELVWGRVPEVICRVAQERDCDLIVVGSRGLTGFKRLMLGSISNAVAAKALCPVLVVKLYER